MNPSRLLLCTVVLTASLVFSGCMMGPDYRRPETAGPDGWQSFAADPDNGETADLSQWWTYFNDENLDRLIQQVTTNNLDLKTAAARIQEASALRGVASGDWFPQVNGSAAAASTRLSDVSGGALVEDRKPDLYNVGIDASWELDLWGRIRRSVESADASLQASVEAYRDTMVVLFAEVANAYLSTCELQMRISLARKNIENQKDTLDLTTGRYDAGLVPAMDVQQSDLNLARTESSLPSLEQQLAASYNRLAVLTGRTPQELRSELGHIAQVPSPDFSVLEDLPTDILRQRPDVRQAEQQLIAQSAQIGVAKADLLPRISLSGSFALESYHIGDLGDSGSQAWQFGPSLRWSLFQGGRIRNNIRAEEARTEQAVFQYQQAVLLALEDVENAFVSYRQERDRLEYIRRSVSAASQYTRQVNTLYENGLVTFLNVLDAERSLAEQEDSMAQSAGQLSRNIVGIYRSLGGGWLIPTPASDAQKDTADTVPDAPATESGASEENS